MKSPKLWENLGLSALWMLDPERAHDIALRSLQSGLLPLDGCMTSARLRTHIAGLDLPNPVGLAAGFDKNARAITGLAKAGFGFLELGAATPRAQPGNPKPRLFRLTKDRAIINRFGFNNDGAKAIAARLAHTDVAVPVGLNLGANKDSADKAADFAKVLTECGPFVDFATVNVSSPNTEKLRHLQGKEALSAVLQSVMGARQELDKPLAVFLKIAPDLDDHALADIAEVAMAHHVDAIIATNTTLRRDGLHSPHKNQAGGLSGAPLFDQSTRILARLYQMTDGQIPLIGVGGVATAQQAWEKIRAGASAVQIYSALIYHGITLAARIASALDDRMAREGVANIADIVGTGLHDWA
jgi:dihydroorotate dehydrogenase